MITIVVIIVISASLGGDDAPSGSGAQRGGKGGATTTTTKTEKPPKKYVIQPGDSLSAIANRFGVTVEEIQSLNPDADAQALVTGQELKLR